jgi:hypothetical protein
MTPVEIGFLLGGLVGLVLGVNETIKLIKKWNTRNQGEHASHNQQISQQEYNLSKSMQTTIMSDRVWVNIFLGTLSLLMAMGWFYMLYMVAKEHPITNESLGAFLFLVAVGVFFLIYGIYSFLRSWRKVK